jgi:preprotein translocase subunit SecB
MADPKNGKTKQSAPAGGDPQPVKAQVVAQYIKDLSFENPGITKLIERPSQTPNLTLEINVQANSAGEDLYESGIDLRARAKVEKSVLYELELNYAGLFKIQNIPEPSLEPFLLINCPTLIFPFLRRIVADTTREGGFPPLMLDPIDFAALYFSRKQEEATAQGQQAN